jgi:hypothetical protein
MRPRSRDVRPLVAENQDESAAFIGKGANPQLLQSLTIDVVNSRFVRLLIDAFEMSLRAARIASLPAIEGHIITLASF